MELLSIVDRAGVHSSAPDYVEALANGLFWEEEGDGVFREFVEVLIWHLILNKVYLENF